ncbi:MAG: ABC transporter ATP-binding protein [SAR324 cluster bacterium]|nr:ABC transporter ATP-binding protein [SAR324 cluster bacterium]
MKGLHIFGLSHSYGNNQVLDNVGLMIPAGELVCMLGPSGCGKSTLLRLAGGLEKVQKGNIVIDDVTVGSTEFHLNPEHRRIGLMFQDYALFPHLDTVRNVTFGLIGMDKEKARRKAMEMLDQVGMTSHADKYPHMLSGGQQQRVALARALAPEPKLLLLDEPFSGLDTNMRQRIREETLSVLKQSGVTTLMVTHDPEEAMFMSDRIKIIGAKGRILQVGRPHEIYYHPNHEFVAKLFGMMNQFKGVVRNGQVETPLGEASTDLPDGAEVEVLVRPEGIILEENQSKTETLVELRSSHLLGHDNIVRVRVQGVSKELYVRVHHSFEIELAKQITARLDPEYTFVYALDENVSPPNRYNKSKLVNLQAVTGE